MNNKNLADQLAIEAQNFVEDLKEFRKRNKLKTKKSSLTLLREIRYGSK